MNECLKVKKNNCKNCYKCIRNCPIKAISFGSDQASIVQGECVLCGRCLVCCPQHAKVVRDDLPVAKRLIYSNASVYASIAPSFAANYPEVSLDSMKKALKKLGFVDAMETAVGATVVKAGYDNLIEKGSQKVIISSCCHTVNMLIQRYYPKALQYLAQIQSPMLAHSAIIKKEFPNAKTVFIGPCISKKDEAEQYPGIVDCVISFEGLSKWLFDENIKLEKDKNPTQSGKAGMFPIPGGIIRSMKADNKNYRYISISGMEQCKAALEDITEGNIDKCFIEMSACEGSCVSGPMMDSVRSTPIKSQLAIEKQAGDFDLEVTMPKEEELKKPILSQPIRNDLPDENLIKEALARIGKTKPSDELNCGSCGYETCREKAITAIRGKSDETMCMPYLMERAQSFSETVINHSLSGVMVLNENLEISQLNASAMRILNIDNSQTALGKHIAAYFAPEPFIEVAEKKKSLNEKKLYLPEYEKHLSLTIIFEAGSQIIITIFRDITESETAREIKEARDLKTIEITDKVIEKQMAAVQVIASLLGETTAETKVALSKLKETLLNE